MFPGFEKAIAMAEASSQDRKPKVCECGEHGFVVLTRWHVAFFSPDDLEKVSGGVWYSDHRRDATYAARLTQTKNFRTKIYLHRLITGATKGVTTDHIDGDGLNNRRENLRVCSNIENCRSRHKARGRSKFKGVLWNRQNQKWKANITIDSRLKHLGFFDDDVLAARAYDRAVQVYFGEFCMTNEAMGLFR